MTEQLKENERIVSEFSSVRSKMSNNITFQCYLENVRSERYRQLVEKYRCLKMLPGHETEAQVLKNNMPCIIPAGVCNGGHAVNNLQVHSGLLQIDLDHTNERTEEIFRNVQALPWVVGAHISISGQGLKLFVSVNPEQALQNYEQLYKAVGNAVSLHVNHPYDEKCRILTQPCFYSWHPEAYYNPQATCFQLKDFTSQAKENGNRESGNKENTDGFISHFLNEFERHHPFRRGERNDIALRLGRVAQSKGFSSTELEQLIQIFTQRYANADFSESDIRSRVNAGYQYLAEKKVEEQKNNWCQNGISSTLIPSEQSDEVLSDDEVLEKNNKLKAQLPYIDEDVYDKLPDFFKRCCQYAIDRRERDLTLLGSLNSCSAALPHVRFYYKRVIYSPHFYLAAVAAAGTGKGILAFTSVLLDSIQEYYNQQRKCNRKAYEQALLLWEQEVHQARQEKRTPRIDLKPEEPLSQYLKISATTSKSRLIQSLAAAGEIGCHMSTTEINTLISSLGQDYGKYEDILCKAAHHEEISSSYKVDGEPIVVPHPHLAICIAGTQEQFQNFFRSLEIGLYSRFAVYTRQQNPVWESCAPSQDEVDLHTHFHHLGQELRNMHEKLLQSPTLVTFSQEQWEYHTQTFSRLLERAVVEGQESTTAIIYRSGLLAMRIAAILTAFRKYEDFPNLKEYACTNNDFNCAISIVQTLIEHSLLLSTSLPESSRPPISMHSFHRLELILSQLPRRFAYMDFVKSAQNSGVSMATGKRLVRKAVEMQLIEKQEDSYRKKNQKKIKMGVK